MTATIPMYIVAAIMTFVLQDEMFVRKHNFCDAYCLFTTVSVHSVDFKYTYLYADVTLVAERNVFKNDGLR